jgi:Flp pilus assembly protein TadG
MFRRRTMGTLPFEREGRHSVKAIFVMMSVALFLAAGAALDYARVVNMREGIESGVRSASEAAARVLRRGDVSDGEITAVILSHFDKDGAFARQVGTIEMPTVSIDRALQSVTVDTKGTVMMTVSRLGGVNEVTVPATSTSSWAPPHADAQEGRYR